MATIRALVALCYTLALFAACGPPRNPGESTWDWWRRTNVHYVYDQTSGDTGWYDAAGDVVHLNVGAIQAAASSSGVPFDRILLYIASHEAGHKVGLRFGLLVFTAACQTGCGPDGRMWLERDAECVTQVGHPELAGTAQDIGWSATAYWVCPRQWLDAYRTRMAAAGMIDPG